MTSPTNLGELNVRLDADQMATVVEQLVTLIVTKNHDTPVSITVEGSSMNTRGVTPVKFKLNLRLLK